MADTFDWSSFEDPVTEKTQGTINALPSDFSGPLELSTEQPSGLAGFGIGLAKGTVYGIPKLLSQSAEALGIESAKPITKWAEEGLGNQEKGVLETTGEMIPASVGIPAAAMTLGKLISLIPHPFAKLAGGALSLGGQFATPALFGLSQYQETKQRAEEKGIDPGMSPYATGAIEWLGETAANMALTKLFGPLAGIGRAAKDSVAKMSIAQNLKGSIGSYLKTLGSVVLPTEVLTEMGQNWGEAMVEKQSGIRPEAEPGKEALSAIAPTTLMTMILGPFGRFAQSHVANKQAEILSKPVDANNPDFEEMARTRVNIAKGIENIIPEENQELRQKWAEYSYNRIMRNEPIDINKQLDSLSLDIENQFDNIPAEKAAISEVAGTTVGENTTNEILKQADQQNVETVTQPLETVAAAEQNIPEQVVVPEPAIQQVPNLELPEATPKTVDGIGLNSENVEIPTVFKNASMDQLTQWADAGLNGAKLELKRRVAEGINVAEVPTTMSVNVADKTNTIPTTATPTETKNVSMPDTTETNNIVQPEVSAQTELIAEAKAKPVSEAKTIPVTKKAESTVITPKVQKSYVLDKLDALIADHRPKWKDEFGSNLSDAEIDAALLKGKFGSENIPENEKVIVIDVPNGVQYKIPNTLRNLLVFQKKMKAMSTSSAIPEFGEKYPSKKPTGKPIEQIEKEAAEEHQKQLDKIEESQRAYEDNKVSLKNNYEHSIGEGKVEAEKNADKWNQIITDIQDKKIFLKSLASEFHGKTPSYAMVREKTNVANNAIGKLNTQANNLKNKIKNTYPSLYKEMFGSSANAADPKISPSEGKGTTETRAKIAKSKATFLTLSTPQTVTDINGKEVELSPSEPFYRIEHNPDKTITLIDGKKIKITLKELKGIEGNFSTTPNPAAGGMTDTMRSKLQTVKDSLTGQTLHGQGVNQTSIDAPILPTYNLTNPVKTAIGSLFSNFYKHPENMPKDEYDKIYNVSKEAGYAGKAINYALSVPFRFSQDPKKPFWKEIWRVHGIDRVENRAELTKQIAEIAEPFLIMENKESIDKVQRVLLAGNREGVEYAEEQLLDGITDKYGNKIVLSPDEITAYQSVRKALDFALKTKIDHFAAEALEGYRTKKWYGLLTAAAGIDLNSNTTQTLLEGKGLNAAALAKARKIQVDVGALFDRIENNITEVPLEEAVQAGALYNKWATQMQVDYVTFHDFVGEVTGVKNKQELDNLAKEVFSAYVQTRPQFRRIRQLRNEAGKRTGYFPQYRKEGRVKLRIYEHVTDENGVETVKELHSKMFDNQVEGVTAWKEAMSLYADKETGKLPDNLELIYDHTTITPEGAFQGVNDSGMQRIIDNAIKVLKDKNVMGPNGTYTDASGNKINIYDQLSEESYQALANQLKSRGANRFNIRRSEDEITGYEEQDLKQVLLNYITSTSGLMTKQTAARESLKILSQVTDPLDFAAMSRYNKEMLRNDSTADKVAGFGRTFAFTYFIGGLLKSPAVNFTQNFLTGIPELAKYMRDNNLGGAGKADLQYIGAMKDVLMSNSDDLTTADSLSIAEKQHINKLITRGVAVDQYIRSIFENVGSSSKFYRNHIKIIEILARPFSLSEIYNRKSAAIAIYRSAYNMHLKNAIAEGLSQEDAVKQAEENTFNDTRTFIDNVHYAYGKTNRPLAIMTGDTIGSIASGAYTFKGFSHNFLARQADLMSQKDWWTLVHTMAYLSLFGGLSALPFVKDALEWVEKKYGYSPTNAIRKSLRGVGGETLEKFGISGLPSVLGANISGSLATGLPWPIGANSPEDSIFGVWAGITTKIGRSAQAVGRGDYNRAGKELLPEFMRNPSTAAHESEIGKKIFGTTGYATNPRGNVMLDENNKPISMSTSEALWKIGGFNPTDYARAKEKNQTLIRQEKWANEAKQEISERFRIARLNGDPNALRDMIKGVAEVNNAIRARGLQTLVPLTSVSKVIQASLQPHGIKQMREMMYKQGL